MFAMYWCQEPMINGDFILESLNTCWGDNSSTKVSEDFGGVKGIRCIREVTKGRGDLPVKDQVLELLRVKKGFVEVSEVSNQKEHLLKEVFLLFFLVYNLKLLTMLIDDLVVIWISGTELSSTKRDGESIVEGFW